MKTTLIVW